MLVPGARKRAKSEHDGYGTASEGGGLAEKSGFSLFELLIAIAILASVYFLAAPNFNLQTGNEIATNLSRISKDVKSAFDSALLTNTYYRLVFNLDENKYWLEETDASYLKFGGSNEAAGGSGEGEDLSIEEEAQRAKEFEESFKEYVKSWGEPVKSDKVEVRPYSPVLNAKSKLGFPRWRKVKTSEWFQPRVISQAIKITEVKAEHHSNPVTEGLAIIYFRPGWVEAATISIGEEGREPYTLVISPNEGRVSMENDKV